jgi:hypothetical protein
MAGTQASMGLRVWTPDHLSLDRFEIIVLGFRLEPFLQTICGVLHGEWSKWKVKETNSQHHCGTILRDDRE